MFTDTNALDLMQETFNTHDQIEREREDTPTGWVGEERPNTATRILPPAAQQQH
jgi:hypothetical protein